MDAIAGMSQSRNPFDVFGRNPNTVAHLRFAVGVTSVAARDDDRQRQPAGVFCNTTAVVRFAYRIRPKDQQLSYRSAFDQADLITQAITNRTPAVYTNLQIRFAGMSYRIANSGEYMILDMSFSILHYLPL